MPVDLNNLSGPQKKLLRDAFLAAYKADTLKMFLQDELDKQLDAIVGGGAFNVVVFDLINLAQNEGWTDQLVAAAERNTKNIRIQELRQTLETSASVKLGEVDAQVRLSAPAGGGLERMVRNVGFADWGLWVARMSEIGRQICRIEYPVGVNMGAGTGILVATDLVLTNYHVIQKHQQEELPADEIICRFDYGVGLGGAPTPVKLAAKWLVDSSPFSPHDPGDNGGLPATNHLDYALLRLERSISNDLVNGAKRKSLKLQLAAAVPAKGDIVFIGQHPKMDPLKLAVGAILKINGNGTRMQYDANTDEGSSGSPCLDVGLNVVALHHGGDPDYAHLKGQSNQGIPIGLILKQMQNRGVSQFWI